MLHKNQHKISYSTKWIKKKMSNLSAIHSNKFHQLTEILWPPKILPLKILMKTLLMDLSSIPNSKPLFNNQKLPLLRLRRLLPHSSQNQLLVTSENKKFNFPKLNKTRELKAASFKLPSLELVMTSPTQSINLLWQKPWHCKMEVSSIRNWPRSILTARMMLLSKNPSVILLLIRKRMSLSRKIQSNTLLHKNKKDKNSSMILAKWYLTQLLLPWSLKLQPNQWWTIWLKIKTPWRSITMYQKLSWPNMDKFLPFKLTSWNSPQELTHKITSPKLTSDG